MRRASLLLATSLLVSGPALAGKKKKDKGGDADAAAETVPTETPGDANSKKFADALIAATITDFKPVDNVGATFVYSTMSFEAGNTWKAQGYVEIQDERMECTESGSWTMEPADSATKATVSWTVDSTDCPGRESGKETRAELDVSKGDFSAIFR